MKNNTYILVLSILLAVLLGCTDFVQVDVPPNQLSSVNTFSEEGSARAAIAGIYTSLGSGSLSANTQLSIEYYADRLVLNGTNEADAQFMRKEIMNNNSYISSYWNDLYKLIYYSNSAMESLDGSPILTSVKNQLLGETLFLRAFCYYYLVNLWGDVPLILTTDWRVNQGLERSDREAILEQIAADLEQAKLLLTKELTSERVTANYYAAAALLSRVYSQLGDWKKTKENATEVIANASYTLENMEDAFLKESRESILSLMSVDAFFKNTNIGQQIVPRSATAIPNIGVSQTLLDIFEPDDQRKERWLASTTINNMVYFYPYKYKEGLLSQERKENLVVLRLAEQFLIRAEACLMLSDQAGALEDVNKIRARASLPPLGLSTDESILAAIQSEKDKEFFAEWGIGRLGSKGVQPYWPIPLSQSEANPNL